MAAATFSASTGIMASRQLLRHYRQRIEKNANSLAMALIEIHNLKEPPITEKADKKEMVRQVLSNILCPQGDSLKIFERTRTTYLTHQAI
jgi:hypothetical protein